MTKFGSRGLSLFSEPANWFGRFGMWTVSAVAATQEWAFPSQVYMVSFAAVFDGWLRWWVAPTSRSFVVRPSGLALCSLFRVRVVPWENVSAIQTFHYPTYTDVVAIHYQWAGHRDVATCSARAPAGELRQFVSECASCVPQPTTIVVAGIAERGVWSRLIRRWVEDIVVAGLVGAAMGVARPMALLGLVAASSSAVVAVARYQWRTTTLIQQDGLWTWQKPRSRPLRTIPRALRHWVHGLEEAAYRGQSVPEPGSNGIQQERSISQ